MGVTDNLPMTEQALEARLATSGLRSTPQRQHVYNVLVVQRDHPTAEEVFIRTKQEHPDISMATVYNCLDTLVKCGLVKAVHLAKGPTRYCPNMTEHYHFYCDACGRIFDVDASTRRSVVQAPKGFKVDHYDIAIHGVCADCAQSN